MKKWSPLLGEFCILNTLYCFLCKKSFNVNGKDGAHVQVIREIGATLLVNCTVICASCGKRLQKLIERLKFVNKLEL